MGRYVVCVGSSDIILALYQADCRKISDRHLVIIVKVILPCPEVSQSCPCLL